MTSTRRMRSWKNAAWNLKARRKNNPGAPTRCSRTAKGIDSSFHRTEGTVASNRGETFQRADLALTKSKASLFLACAGVVDLHRLLFLAALVFVHSSIIWLLSATFSTSRTCDFIPGTISI